MKRRTKMGRGSQGVRGTSAMAEMEGEVQREGGPEGTEEGAGAGGWAESQW